MDRASICEASTYSHRTGTLFDPTLKDDELGLIVLNNRHSIPSSMLDGTMLCSPRSIVCADGGANVLYDATDTELIEVAAPAAIIGDLDSVRPEVVSHYKDECGTKIINDDDQNRHDLDKCLGYLASKQHAKVIVIGAFGGRIDHEMACINALYRWQSVFSNGLFMLSAESLGLLLMPGQHSIFPHDKIEGPTCGLIPIGRPCRSVTTSGLKWNLDGRFGHTAAFVCLFVTPCKLVSITQKRNLYAAN